MELIANIMLAAGAFGLAAYCFILQKKISKFAQLEDGMGGAIAVLSAQVDDMTKVLTKAQSAAEDSTLKLNNLTTRAEASAIRLELLLSSLHDLPEPEDDSQSEAQDKRMRFVRHRSRRDQEAAE